MSDEILFERRGTRGEIAWLSFNRPEARNALTWSMYERLHELFAEVTADRSIRCLVMTGNGRAFVAGTDISQFRAFDTEEQALEYEENGDRLYTALEQVPCPVIAAIPGPCTGAGFGLAGVSDLRIASPNARLGIPIARTLGNCLSQANYARFAALMGVARVKEMIFLARLYSAQEALQIGLLNEVVDTEEALLPRAEELAGVLAEHAPLTLWATKEALRRYVRGLRPDGGQDIVTRVYLSRDFKEGVEAFLAKRKPDWRGD